MDDLGKFTALAGFGQQVIDLVKESGLMKKKGGKRKVKKRKGKRKVAVKKAALVAVVKKARKKRRAKPIPLPIAETATA